MRLHESLVLRFPSVLELPHDSVQVRNILLDPLDALVLPQHAVDHPSDQAELLQPLLVLFEGHEGRDLAFTGLPDELDFGLTADDAARLADLELFGAVHDLGVELKAELGPGLVDEHRQQLEEVLVDPDLDGLLLAVHQRHHQPVLQVLQQVGPVLEPVDLRDGEGRFCEGALSDEAENAPVVGGKEMRGPLDEDVDLFSIDLELLELELVLQLRLPQLHPLFITLYIARPP